MTVREGSPWPEIHRAEIDGIAVVWIDGPKPYASNLGFRVGIWDEAVPNRGINHLVEHLALNPLRSSELQFNGIVSGARTDFQAWGRAEEAAGFLERVCEGIAAAPTADIDREVGILGAESAGRVKSPGEELRRSHFGARGPGVSAYKELGLSWLGRAELEVWTGERFTRANAALAFTGPPPEDLNLSLPTGARRPLELPPSLLPPASSPRRVGSRDDGFGWFSAPRVDRRILLAMKMVQERLKEKLRYEQGLVYAIETDFDLIAEGVTMVYTGARCEPKNVLRMSTEFLGVLEEFAEHGPTEEEMARMRRRGRAEEKEGPEELARSELARALQSELLGIEYRGWGEEEARAHAFGAEDIQQAFQTAYASSVVQGHEELQGLEHYEPPRRAPIEGTEFRPKRNKTELDALRIGRDGIAWRVGEQWTSIAWSDLAMIFEYTPTARIVLGMDDASLLLYAEHWKRPGELLEALKQHAPEDRWIAPVRRSHITGESEHRSGTEQRGPADHEEGALAAAKRWWQKLRGR